jgi:uncharacterized protein DUF3631
MSTNGNGLPLPFDAGLITPNPIGDILTDTLDFVRRFVSLTDAQLTIVTLWIVHTHTFEIYDGSTPYLHISSPEKQCGKSRLLEVLELLTRKAWFTGHATPAALVRKIGADCPTLLLDETDQALKSGDEYAAALTGILNNGYRPGMPYTMCIGQGTKIVQRDFNVFCPKAIAGIGSLPDTVADRSVPIRMERQIGRKAEKFRRREVLPIADPLQIRISKWAHRRQADWLTARPEFPPCLSDRQEDVIEPLLAIADDAGGDWPTQARQALTELFAGNRQDGESIGGKLLGDIRDIFADRLWEKIASADLAEALAGIETSPWGEWGKTRKPITPTSLAKLLKPFKIFPKTVRVTAGTIKGYTRETFADAWDRYLPKDGSVPVIGEIEPSQPSQLNIHAGPGHFSTPSQKDNVAPSKSEESPISMRVVTGVTDGIPDTRQKRGKTLPSCPVCGGFALYREPSGVTTCESCVARSAN